MSTGQIIQLVLQALVFLAWAVLMYRMISTVHQRSGKSEHGFITHMGQWLRSPEDRSERSTLFFLTFVLIVMSFSSVILG